MKEPTMNTKNFNTIISTVFAFLLIFTSSSMGLASPPGEDLALVRIEFLSPDATDQFSVMGIPVHGRFYDEAGKTSWLAFLGLDQRLSLEIQGISITVLDGNTTGKDYFLVKLNTLNASSKFDSVGSVLAVVNDQAIVAVTQDQAEALFNLGYEIEHISRQPILFSDTARTSRFPIAISPNPTIALMFDQVNKTVVSKVDGDLSGEWSVTIGGSPYTISTRHTGNASASTMVTQFAYEQFDSFGLSVEYHNYTHPYYGARRNVVAEQQGIGQPERIFFITAHIDDMPSGPIAPGADDNASGSTGVLLAAEILSQYDFDCTLRYALFTGEEQGLHGSYAYAQDAYNAGDDIEVVLNLDMIAYDYDKQPILDLHTRPGNSSDLAIANTFAGVIDAYDLNLTANIFQSGMGYSDHASFWDFGFPAILAIEDDDDFTPYYHTTSDTLSTLNLIYFSNFVKASLGTLAHLGCLLPTISTVNGTVTEADGGTPISGAPVEAQFSNTVIDSTTSAPNGNYTLNLPVGTYTMAASYPDYVLQSIADVTVTEGMTTTVDFALEKAEPINGLDFTYLPLEVKIGQTVTFTGTVISGTLPVTYTWDFGDGSEGTGAVVTHQFPITVPQTYTVTLTAENGYGPPLSEDKTIMVWAYQIYLSPIFKSLP
jgi:PKD repeat protein